MRAKASDEGPDPVAGAAEAVLKRTAYQPPAAVVDLERPRGPVGPFVLSIGQRLLAMARASG